jgi:hypothetical protein
MKAIAAALFIALSVQNAFADDFETSFTQDFAAYYPTLKANTQNIWPGFVIGAKHPTLLYFHDSDHTYGFDFTPTAAFWKQQTMAGLTVPFLEKDEIGIAAFDIYLGHFYLNVDGAQAVVAQPFELFSDREKTFKFNLKYLLIEHYMGYELTDSPYAQSKQALIKSMSYTGFHQADNLTLLYLQNQLIQSYLQTFNQELLKDYVALSVTRHELLDAQTNQFEKIQAPFVTDYISTKGVSQNDAEYAKFALDGAKEEVPAFNELSIYTMNPGDYEMGLSFSAMGVDLALDKLSPTWKEAVESQNAVPDDILQQFFNLSDSEIRKRVADVKARLSYDALNHQIKAILDPYAVKIDELQKSYQADNGIEFNISLKANETLENGDSYYVNSESKISNADVFRLTSEELGLNLSIKNLAVLKETYTDSGKVYTFKVQPTATLIINGMQMTIAELVADSRKRSVESLEITSGSTTVYLLELQKDKLSLESKDGKLYLNWVTRSGKLPATLVQQKGISRNLL